MDIVLENGGFFRFAVKKEDKIYVIINEGGILAAYDVRRKEWNLQFILPECYKSYQSLFFCLEKNKNIIYLIPQNNSKILIYDLDTDAYEYIPIVSENSRYAAVAGEYKNNFILLPTNIDGEVIFFDKMSKQIRYDLEWKKPLIKNMENMKLHFLSIRRSGSCIIDDMLYCVAECREEDVVLAFCLPDMKMHKIYRLGISGRLFVVKADEDKIWIQNRKAEGSKLIYWNPRTENIEKKTVLFPDINKRVTDLQKSEKFIYVFSNDGKVIFLEQESLCRKKSLEHIFVYLFENSEIMITKNNGEAKLLNLRNFESKEIYMPKAFFLKCIFEFIKISETELKAKNRIKIGQSILEDIK